MADPKLQGAAPDPVQLQTLVTRHTAGFENRARWVDDDDPPSLELVAPYSDLGSLARGGMGLVRRAWDPELHRHVAVKVIRPSLAEDESVVERFLQEARITGQLDHPGIVPVHALGRAPGGAPCLVMKRVEGRTLTDHLRALPPPPWPPAVLDEVLGIFLKICDAVAFAHARGVVHRDLKPDNVMVGGFGQVYVMDWGIARVLPREGEEEPPPVSDDGDTTPMGTPGYMTPEQALRNESAISERTDVYLLGAVLYEILCGRTPHEGPTLMAVLYHAIAGEIVPPEKVSPARQPPLALSRIALKALEKDPARRYPSVLDLKHDVEAFLRGDERAPTRTFAAGERVLTEGEEARAAYVIVSGRAVVYQEREGDRDVLRELGPGEVFGETSVFTSQPVSATVEAVDVLEVKVVTRESLSESVGLQTWMGTFVEKLAERFRDVDERLRALERG